MNSAPYSKFTFACLAIKGDLVFGTPIFAAEQVVVAGSSALFVPTAITDVLHGLPTETNLTLPTICLAVALMR